MDATQEGIVDRLSEDECWELLSRASLGRLALNVRNELDIFPINFVTHDGAILFRTAPGTKLAELTANPRVVFEADEYDERSAASVIVKGVAEEMQHQSEIDAADALPLVPWIPTLKYRWVRIVPTSITGRRFERAPEPDRYAVIDD